ncbi:MAG: 50S ribosomal protein L4 [Muribaculaceae bacterium]|jgi:large subunit ribosomal protein L4|nr:50S ribosomal protein L4 [Bacteroidales bacterium]MBQ1745672.1 50S ribosomal protein L4 [Muribaculaceae bacterium]MBR0493950.1 50S ribosomal protein L4 [Muribaculaceae bacterium]MBR3727371.1 50S ribosomal protein L4 [Muribaculaceae bacterium]
MELAVYNIKGEDTGRKVTLNDEIFAIAEPNEHAVYLDVKQFLANKRQGTHKAKERSEIAGSTKKLGRQKGGGGARHGDIKSPLFHGGGRVFGPRPRNYGFKLNKKVKALARRSALTYKAQNNQIMVIEDIKFDAPKTKEFVNITRNLKLEGQKLLLVLAGQERNLYLSLRNVPTASVVTASDINTYRVLDNRMILVTESSVDALNNLK